MFCRFQPGKIIGSKYKHYTIEEIWQRDYKRIVLIEKRGFEIIRQNFRKCHLF